MSDSIITDSKSQDSMMVREATIEQLAELGKVEICIGDEDVYFSADDGNFYYLKKAVLYNFVGQKRSSAITG